MEFSDCIIRNVFYEPGTMELPAERPRLDMFRFSSVSCREDFHYCLHEHVLYEMIFPRGTIPYHCALNGKGLELPPGKALLIQAGDRHEDWFVPNAELVFFIFDLHDARGGFWHHGIWNAAITPEQRIIDVQENSTTERMIAMLLEMERGNPLADMGFGKLAEALIWDLISTIPPELLSPGFYAGVELSQFQSRILEYFEQCAGRGLDIKDMASKMGMSRRTLEYKFKQVFGASPAMVFTRHKIMTATRMLNNGASIKHVADRLGFCDAFYFSTVFKRVTGITPSELKRGQSLR